MGVTMDGDSATARGARLVVDVRELSDEPLADAAVTLRPLAEHGGEGRRLEFDDAIRAYVADELVPGRYELRVDRDDMGEQWREVIVQPAGSTEIFVLGRKGLPSYYREKVEVPFDVDADLVAITLRAGVQGREHELHDVTRKLGLERREAPEEAHRAGIRLFRLGKRGEGPRREALEKLRQHGLVEHAGAVIGLRERGLTHLTDEAVVCFRPHITETEARTIAREYGFAVLRDIPYSANTYHLRSSEPGTLELLDTLAKLASLEEVEWAEPNVVATPELDAVNPPDFLAPGLWDRKLAGINDAWQRLQDAGLETYGDPGITIAMVDQGIVSLGGVPSHPDFQGTVSDGSPKVAQLFDFATMVANNDSPLGNHGMGTAGVSTARATNPAAVAGEFEGLAGAAPNCRVMGLIFPASEVAIADMYIWAAGFNPNSPAAGFPAPIGQGADIFSTSIGFGAGAPLSGTAKAMLDYLMTFGRGGKGCLCFFSAGNGDWDNTTNRPYSAYEKSFGMAASSLAGDGVTEIRAPYSGYNKVQLCAPSHDQYVSGAAFHNPPGNFAPWSCDFPGQGNLPGYRAVQTPLTANAPAGATSVKVANVAGLAAGQIVLVGAPGAPGSEPAQTTGAPDPAAKTVPVCAWVAGAGFSPGTGLVNAHSPGDKLIQGPPNYRNDFGGTSSATPLAAGIAALLLSAEPDLTWIEARQILRDTAVKFDTANNDPIGRWLDADGNPSNVSGQPPVFSKWYGYGRVDAEAAIQEGLIYGFARDIVVRDNLADIGAVPAAGAYWNSPDIWVRTASPAMEGGTALPASYAVAGPHVAPVAGQSNWVYARVKNTGSLESLDCYVRISLTHWPGLEFTYPSSFTPTIRPDAPLPSPLVPGTYLIGEVKLSGIAPGDDEIVNVEWPASLIPPADVLVGTTNVHWHPCLLVETSPQDGPPATGDHVWDSNNLGQKNISIVYSDAGKDFAMGLIAGHEEDMAKYLVLEIDRGKLPPEVRLYVDLVNPILKRRLRAEPGKPDMEPRYKTASEALIQEELYLRLQEGEAGQSPTGGMVLTVPQTSPAVTMAPRFPRRRPPRYTIGYHDGREVAFLALRGKTSVPIYAGPGVLSPIIVGGIAGRGARPGEYSVAFVQRDPQGRVTGAAELAVTIRAGEAAET